MEPRCTCGALLPADARFCHKCGRPQYEEDIERLSSSSEAASIPVQAPLDVPIAGTAVPIGFGNIRAVVTTMAVAAFALVVLLIFAMFAPPLGLLVLCAAGYAAAYVYRRQTAQPLSTGGGAYLGLMTGLWLFLVFAMSVAAIGIELGSPTGREMLRVGMARVPEAAKMLDNPHELLVSITETLIPMFFLATVSAAFGGMLAARTLARRPQP